MDIPYKPPALEESAFNCPHCGAFAHQTSGRVCAFYSNYGTDLTGLTAVLCSRCEKFSVWMAGEMIYPDGSSAPPPNPDMSEDIRHDYMEAREIVNRSPRGAAALLRLCIEKFCRELNPGSKDLNNCIGGLVDQGLLRSRIQKALDSVRVLGNEAVHPGQIDLKDDPETAYKLFKLVNTIVREVISEEKEIDDIYAGLPKEKLEGIKKRDSREKQKKGPSKP